jgi:hypothetical protein
MICASISAKLLPVADAGASAEREVGECRAARGVLGCEALGIERLGVLPKLGMAVRDPLRERDEHPVGIR